MYFRLPPQGLGGKSWLGGDSVETQWPGRPRRLPAHFLPSLAPQG